MQRARIIWMKRQAFVKHVLQHSKQEDIIFILKGRPIV
jgi:hypothetical protein